MKNNFLLFLLVCTYLFIRLYKLTEIPYGFHRDEASIGYNAYSILKTGRDEWGKTMPIFSKAFGDYPPVLVFYTTIPFIFIFGLDEFAVRTSIVFFSFINFFLVYKILTKIKLDRRITLLTLFVLTFSPWEITQSRATSEVILGSCFFLIGVYSLICFYYRQKLSYFLSFFISWILTYFSYNSFRILMPLLSLVVTLFLIKTLKIKWKYVIFLIFITIFPLFITYISSETQQKGKQNLFIYDIHISDSINVLNTQSGLMGSSILLTRIFHNKISYITFSLIKNTFDVISSNFLYRFEAIPYRYGVPENGLFLFTTAPFLIFGIWFFCKSKIKFYNKILFFCLIFIGFLPAIITTGDFPNNRRSFLVVYPIILVIAIGVHNFLKIFKYKKIIVGSLIFLFLLNFIYFWFFYEFHSPFKVAHARNYFYKQMAQIIYNNYEKYQKIKIYSFSEQPYIFLLFFNKYDPKKYQEEIKNIPKDQDLFSLKTSWSFDKYIFTPEECPFPNKNELVFAENSRCNKILKEKFDNYQLKLNGYVYSPYGSKELMFYELN